jgi:hypothetical protein
LQGQQAGAAQAGEEGTFTWLVSSERQKQDLAKLILTADQINLHLLQCIADID